MNTFTIKAEGVETVVETTGNVKQLMEAIYFVNSLCEVTEDYGSFYDDLGEYLRVYHKVDFYVNESDVLDGDNKDKPEFLTDNTVEDRVRDFLEENYPEFI